jgi:membrane protease YdiL (CAAX protease family)
MSKGSKIFKRLQDKKAEKIKQSEVRRLKRDENLSLKEKIPVLSGIIIFLVLYSVLFFVNKFFYDLSDYYLLILSAYFLIFSIVYIKIKKLTMKNLLLKGSPLKKDLGVLIGLLIFIYYIVSSNLFIDLFNINSYNSSNDLLLIVTIIITTLSSELFFRGIIQRGLKINYNKTISILIQAVLWSMLKADVFLINFNNVFNGLIGFLLIIPIGLLFGYVKEEWYFDSCLSASITNSLLSIVSIII